MRRKERNPSQRLCKGSPAAAGLPIEGNGHTTKPPSSDAAQNSAPSSDEQRGFVAQAPHGPSVSPTRGIITMDNMEHQLKFRLSVRNTSDTCLDASAGQRRTASEIRFPMFSACRWHAKQMWELNVNGNLVSSYSGLCATVKSRNKGPNEARAWVATGSKGEIYLAFFNLDSTSRKMAARMSDLGLVLRRALLRKHLCSCTEVWSGKNFSLTKDEISAVVNPHASMVFEIIC